MHRFRVMLALALAALLPLSGTPARAQLTGSLNIVVLRVQFSDMVGSTFTAAQTTGLFNNIAKLWGSDSSYGKMSLNFRISPLYSIPGTTASYIDLGNNFSTPAAVTQLVSAAVQNAPSSINWSNVHSVMILFADTRSSGKYRGITYGGYGISPPGRIPFAAGFDRR